MPAATNAEKYCPKCFKTLSLTLFHKNKSKSDGVATYCKSCISEYGKREDIRAKHYARMKNNAERVKEQWRRSHDNDGHRQRQKERVRAFMKVQSENLGDLYVKSKIARGTGIKFTDIPQSLVELKRAQMMIARALKETK